MTQIPMHRVLALLASSCLRMANKGQARWWWVKREMASAVRCLNTALRTQRRCKGAGTFIANYRTVCFVI